MAYIFLDTAGCLQYWKLILRFDSRSRHTW